MDRGKGRQPERKQPILEEFAKLARSQNQESTWNASSFASREFRSTQRRLALRMSRGNIPSTCVAARLCSGRTGGGSSAKRERKEQQPSGRSRSCSWRAAACPGGAASGHDDGKVWTSRWPYVEGLDRRVRAANRIRCGACPEKLMGAVNEGLKISSLEPQKQNVMIQQQARIAKSAHWRQQSRIGVCP